MKLLCFDPATDRARADAYNLGGLLRGNHLDLAATRRTPHQRGLLTFRRAKHDAFFRFDSHFGRPNNSFPLQAVSRKKQTTREAGPHASCNRPPFLLESAPSDLAEVLARAPVGFSYIERTWKSLGSAEFFLKAL